MQADLTIIWTIVVIYFIILIALGVWSRKAIVSPEDYHIAGRKVGAFINGSAYMAAYLSIASFLGLPAYIFLLGMPFDWALLGIASAMPFGAALVAAQLRKAAPVSTTDYFAWRYETDVYGRIILTVAYLWGSILYIVLCLVGMGLALVATLRVHYLIALVVATVIMLIYLWLGGMVATTLTSAFQAWVMLVSAWAIVVGMFIVAGGPAQLFAMSKEMQPYFFISGAHNPVYVKVLNKPWNFSPDWVFATGIVSVFLWYSVWNWGSIVMPYSVVRIFTTFDRKTARWTLFWAPVFVWIFYVALTIIGIGCRPVVEVFGPHPHIAEGTEIKPGLPTLGVFIYYLKTYGIGSVVDYATIAAAEAVRNPWILGLGIAGILSIGMATISSWAMISATILARDWPHFILKKPLPPKKEILWARIIMVILVVISMFIAIAPPAMVLDLSGAAFLVITAVVGPPLFTGIWWKRGGPRAFKIYATLMLILSTFSWLFSYFVWRRPHVFFLFPYLGTPHQVYWYYVGFLIWVILCLVTKPSSPETIKKYCEDLHTP